MGCAGIGDIEARFVGREGDPVRADEIVGDDGDVARLRIDPADFTTTSLGLLRRLP
jgi:hypothetical protein